MDEQDFLNNEGEFDSEKFAEYMSEQVSDLKDLMQRDCGKTLRDNMREAFAERLARKAGEGSAETRVHVPRVSGEAKHIHEARKARVRARAMEHANAIRGLQAMKYNTAIRGLE